MQKSGLNASAKDIYPDRLAQSAHADLSRYLSLLVSFLLVKDPLCIRISSIVAENRFHVVIIL